MLIRVGGYVDALFAVRIRVAFFSAPHGEMHSVHVDKLAADTLHDSAAGECPIKSIGRGPRGCETNARRLDVQHIPWRAIGSLKFYAHDLQQSSANKTRFHHITPAGKLSVLYLLLLYTHRAQLNGIIL